MHTFVNSFGLSFIFNLTDEVDLQSQDHGLLTIRIDVLKLIPGVYLSSQILCLYHHFHAL